MSEQKEGETSLVGQPTGMHQIIRTIVLYLICAVMGWVGITMTNLQDTSSKQTGVIIHLQDQIEVLQITSSKADASVPLIRSDLDKLEMTVGENGRRITNLEEMRNIRGPHL